METSPQLKVMQMKMASVSSLAVFLLCCSVATSKDSSVHCDFYAATGTDFTVPLEHALDSKGRLIWTLSKTVKTYRDIKNVTSGKEEDLTKNGSYMLKNLKKEQSIVYTSEIYDGNGKQKFRKETRLCVLDPVAKPTVKTECKESKVLFTCQLAPQPNDTEFRWIQNDQIIGDKKKTLQHEASETKTTKFSCQAFNKASSETSEAVSHECSVINALGIPDELFGISIWVFVGGGGGIVLVLIIVVIICCANRKRKRSMHLKEEEELRLQWTRNEQQNHHHHLPPLPGNHPNHNHPHHHEQKQAGHTGPRKSRSNQPRQPRQHRPKAPEPSEGNPHPQPRAAQASRPADNNDEDQPPPLPQPRKKGPKGPVE